MIEAMDKAGRVSTVRIVCDDCGKDEVVVCDYERVSSYVRLPNEGQANRKITGQGWEMVKGKHGCPACKAKRKNHRQALAGLHEEEKRLRLDAEETPNMTKPAAVTPLREPTREQKRQIMSLLEVSYDTDAGRYKGTDTDATVAGAIGGGVMPGWVAELREEFFGPDGGNGEMEALAAEMREWLEKRRKESDNAKVLLDGLQRALAFTNNRIGEADAMLRRLDAIRKAVGPKAGAA